MLPPMGSVSPAFSHWPARLAALATACYVGVLLFATHYPRPQELLGSSPPSDKTLHFIAYGILGLLVGVTLPLAGRQSLRTALWTAAALALFAAFDEATQPLPWFGRAADPLDWVYDCLGIVAGLTASITVVAMLSSWASARGSR
jgi:VanZ family protein